MEKEYYKLTPEEKIRWHLLHDCTCGYLEEWNTPYAHYSSCPLHNENDDGWNYFYDYGILPNSRK